MRNVAQSVQGTFSFLRRVAEQSYEAFARDGLVFVGSQIGFLRDYLDLRGKRVQPATAERRVLAKRRLRKPVEKKICR